MGETPNLNPEANPNRAHDLLRSEGLNLPARAVRYRPALVGYRSAGRDAALSIRPGSWSSTRYHIEEPKSRNGKRTLPLDSELVAALTALRKRQLEESTFAGAAYRQG